MIYEIRYIDTSTHDKSRHTNGRVKISVSVAAQLKEKKKANENVLKDYVIRDGYRDKYWNCGRLTTPGSVVGVWKQMTFFTLVYLSCHSSVAFPKFVRISKVYFNSVNDY